MHMLGVSDKSAQERGGWSTDHIMKSVYTHTFTDDRNAADKKIDSYFDELMQHEMQHEKKETQ